MTRARAGRASSKREASARAPRPQIRIMLRKAIAMGPGKAELLRAIEETGSISAAARTLGMSYRRAWLLVDTMNQCFRSPVVETLTGGQRGGGARVSELGHEVLRRYLEMEAKAAASVQKELAQFTRLMAGH
ncbi:MAG TPA: LysR family transcriptional regulator [Burkholderiales bacterium]|nr:LysR family transcriptional regulator [Burkholderiales bacterium]